MYTRLASAGIIGEHSVPRAILARSTVARVCAELHERLEAFNRRNLFEVKLVVLFLDAIYLPVRRSGPKEGVICA